MSLTLDASTTVTGLIDACDRPASNEVVCLINTSGSAYSVRRYSTAAGHAQVGSDIVLGSTSGNFPTQIIMIDGQYAALTSSNNTTIWIVDLVGGVVVTSGVPASTAAANPSANPARKNNYLASNGSVAVGVATTVGVLTFATSSAFNGVNITTTESIYIDPSNAFTCIIPKGNTGNFLVGSELGEIYEFSVNTGGPLASTFTLVQRLACPYKLYSMVNARPCISNMAYQDGFLLVADSYGFLSLYEWASGSLLQRQVGCNMSSSQQISQYNFSRSMNGSTILMTTGSSTNDTSVAIEAIEYDMFTTPNTHLSTYNLSSALVSAVGGQGSTWWTVQPSSNIITWLTQSGNRATNTISGITGNPASITIGGTGVQGELIILDDTSSPAKELFSTSVPSSGINFPVSTGKSLLMLASYGDGEDEVLEISRVAT